MVNRMIQMYFYGQSDVVIFWKKWAIDIDAHNWSFIVDWQSECFGWRERGETDDDWDAYSGWHFLCWVWINCRLEICKIWRQRFEKILVFVCCLMQLVIWIVSFRRLPMRRTKSTRKGNLSLNGQCKLWDG